MNEAQEELSKSKTYLKYEQAFGRCLKCFENVGVLHPCCNAAVMFEGEVEVPEQLWMKIKKEIGE